MVSKLALNDFVGFDVLDDLTLGPLEVVDLVVLRHFGVVGSVLGNQLRNNWDFVVFQFLGCRLNDRISSKSDCREELGQVLGLLRLFIFLRGGFSFEELGVHLARSFVDKLASFLGLQHARLQIQAEAQHLVVLGNTKVFVPL